MKTYVVGTQKIHRRLFWAPITNDKTDWLENTNNFML